MRLLRLSLALTLTPLALAAQQAADPRVGPTVLDQTATVRFLDVERYQATVEGTGPILLSLGTTGTRAVVPTEGFAVPVLLDPSQAGATIGALTATVQWNPQRLVLDSVTSGTLGTVQTNIAPTSGTVSLSVFSTQGTATTATVATLYFRTTAAVGGTTILLTPTQIGDLGGVSRLGQALARPTQACVTPPGKWGDVNGDGAVNVIDAQQVARRTVDLSVLRPSLVTVQGDVNGDALVDIIDAQQIARADIALSVSTTTAARINTPAFILPPVFSIQVGVPGGDVGIGETRALLASPRSSTGLTLDGCVPLTWSSAAPAVAAVDTTGIVRGLGAGSTPITVSSGSATASTTIVTINRGTTVAALELVDGSDITTYPGVQTGQAVRFRAVSQLGTPVAGVPVTVSFAQGTVLIGSVNASRAVGATTASITATTDAQGIAMVRLWGGTAAPDSGAVTVSAPGQSARTLTVATISPRRGEHICINDGWAPRCWGDGSRGQLGNGSTSASVAPVPLALAPLNGSPVALFAPARFGDHSCLTSGEGLAYCWGSNTAGQLGDSTLTDRNVPTRVRTELRFTDLAVGSEHACGVSTAGEIWCWGYNWAGQLGDGSISNRRRMPVRVKAPTGVVFTQVEAGANHSCGGTATGTWYCWGNNTAGQLGDGTTISNPLPVVVAGGALFAELALGEAHSCGRTGTGQVQCWGSGLVGSLGNGLELSSTTPVTVKGAGFTAIYAGYYRACASKADRTLWCWGYNNGGQLGEGTQIDRSIPTLAGFTGQGFVLSGTGFSNSGQTTCGLTVTSQQVFCWGSNLAGKLTVPGDQYQPAPYPILVPRAGATAGVATSVTAASIDPAAFSVASIPAGSTSSSMGLEVKVRDALGAGVTGQAVTFRVLQGDVRFSNNDTTITVATTSIGVASSGLLTFGTTLGPVRIAASVAGAGPGGTTGQVPHVVVAQIIPASNVVTKVTGDSAYVVGVNGYNEIPLVVRVTDAAASPTPIPNASVRFTVVGSTSGTFGGTQTSLDVLTDDTGTATLPATAWVLGTTGGEVTASVLGSSGVTFNRFLGNLTGAVPQTSCERLPSGSVYCWGRGATGTLGNGGTTDASTPVAVSGGLTFSALAVGTAAHECGLVGTTAYCWGLNDAGQLGDSSQVNRATPTLVRGTVAFQQLAVGGNTTCGLTAANALWCWGWSGTAGFTGTPEGAGRAVLAPQAITTPAAFTKIAVADDAVCGLTATGDLWCRGQGADGWNLDGSLTQRHVFTKATGGPWSDVSASYLGLCAIAQSTGRAHCAGFDQGVGALGTGTEVYGAQATLVPVASSRTAVSVVARPFGGCLLASDGATECWGNNNYGQNGTGNLESSVFAPTQIPGLTFTSLRAEAFRTVCGIASSTSMLYCWGRSDFGQLGTGLVSSAATNPNPVAVVGFPLGPSAGTAVQLTAVAPTLGSAVAGSIVTPSPAVVVRDRTGAAVPGVPVTYTRLTGDGTFVDGTVVTDANGVATAGPWVLGPTPGVVHTLSAVAPSLPATTFRYTSITPAGSIVAATNPTQFAFAFETSSRNPLTVLVRDANDLPMVGYPVTYRVTSGASTISGGDRTIIPTDATGRASLGFNWNTASQATGNFTLEASVPGRLPVTFSMVKLVNYGGRTTCRTVSNVPYCWGENTRGEAGTGSLSAVLTPTMLTGVPGFTAFAVGARSLHTCALGAGGQAFCWGDNSVGQLGDSTQTERFTPTPVQTSLAFTKLFRGLNSTCGITTASELACWGWMSQSRIGDGAVGDIRRTPTLVNTNGLTFTSVALALEGTCGLTVSGGVHCWNNISTNLQGDGTAPRALPSTTPIPGLVATTLAAGDRAFCAALVDGGVRCWGTDNGFGQLGNGTTASAPTPVSVGGLPTSDPVTELQFASWTTVCARTAAGRLFCWGRNDVGQLGIGTIGGPNQLTAVEVGASFGVNFTGFHPTATDGRFCAIGSDGISYCWGSGAIGNGSVSGSPFPTPITISAPALRAP